MAEEMVWAFWLSIVGIFGGYFISGQLPHTDEGMRTLFAALCGLLGVTIPFAISINKGKKKGKRSMTDESEN